MLLVVLLTGCTIGLLLYSKLNNVLGEQGMLNIIISTTCSISLLSIMYVTSLFIGASIFEFIMFLTIVSMFSIIYLIWKKAVRFDVGFNMDKMTLVFTFFSFIGTIRFWRYSNRWGDWDGWAIWNLHALFLYDVESWTNLFTDKIAWTHPDYPLLLPSLIALFWKTIGCQAAEVPALISYFVFLLLIGLIYGSSIDKYSKVLSLCGIILLIVDSRFMAYAASQYADCLLSLVILLSVVMSSKKMDRIPFWFVIIGYCSALPMWIKNEGNVFFGINCVAIAYEFRKDFMIVLYYILGALPVLIITGWFKYFYSTSNDIAKSLNADILMKITSIERYELIGSHIYNVVIQNISGILFLLSMALILRHRVILNRNAIVIFLTLSAYLFVYVITPNDLEWHLNTSLDRLLYQLYPTILFLSIGAIYPMFKKDVFSV